MKALKSVTLFFYRMSGLQYVLSEIESFVFRYRLRLRMVPVSYKLFILTLGVLIGGSGVFVRYEYSSLVTPEKWEYENPAINTVQAKEIEKWEIAEFTSYSAGDGFTPGKVMASGRAVYVGAVACPSFLSFGDKIEVKGVGTFTCEDRMAKRFRDGQFFDIYASTVDEALAFGRKSIEYRVIE